jgi:hypothetical protein
MNTNTHEEKRSPEVRFALEPLYGQLRMARPGVIRKHPWISNAFSYMRGTANVFSLA